MLYTPRIEKAIRTAVRLHEGQFRKGEKLAYVSHLFSVALIVTTHTSDEDTIVAALLHDTIEDTHYLPDDMTADFSEAVTAIVLGVSEPKEQDGKKLSWLERKRAYLNILKAAPEASLFVSAADKIHNLQSYIADHEHFRDDLPSKLWFYESVYGILRERLESAIVDELEKTLRETKKAFSIT